MKSKTWLIAAAMALACGSVAAQDRVQYTAPDGASAINVSSAKPLPTSSPPSSLVGTVSAITIGAAPTQVLAAGPRQLLAIDNESLSATIACSFGGTAAINAAGSFTIPPGVTRTWTAYPVPADAVNCIASAANTPATVEAN